MPSSKFTIVLPMVLLGKESLLKSLACSSLLVCKMSTCYSLSGSAPYLTLRRNFCPSHTCGSTSTVHFKSSLDGAGLGPYSGGVAQPFLDLLFFIWKAFSYQKIKMLHGQPSCLQTRIINGQLQCFAHVCPNPQRSLKISSQSGTIQIRILMFKQLFPYWCPAPWFIPTNCLLPLLCRVETQAGCQQPAGKTSSRIVTTRYSGMMQSIEITQMLTWGWGGGGGVGWGGRGGEGIADALS